MTRWDYIENCFVYFATTIGVLGLYNMSGSFHSFWLLLMLSFVNIRKG